MRSKILKAYHQSLNIHFLILPPLEITKTLFKHFEYIHTDDTKVNVKNVVLLIFFFLDFSQNVTDR